jgi:hypothetical protein
MNFDDSDFILKNGYFAKGDPFAIISANPASSFYCSSQSSRGVISWAGQQTAKAPTVPPPI